MKQNLEIKNLISWQYIRNLFNEVSDSSCRSAVIAEFDQNMMENMYKWLSQEKKSIKVKVPLSTVIAIYETLKLVDPNYFNLDAQDLLNTTHKIIINHESRNSNHSRQIGKSGETEKISNLRIR